MQIPNPKPFLRGLPSRNTLARAPTSRAAASRPTSTGEASEAATPNHARYASFREALDEIKRRVESELGEEDVTYMRRVRAFSTLMEASGRSLIHFSLEPVSFFTGVTALWIHKQLEATEIGHTVLHGAYDRLEGADELKSKTFTWKAPIDEPSWRYAHNIRHHGHTNIAGKDPDTHFGHVRLTEQTPHTVHNIYQLPFAVTLIWPNFLFVINAHVTGLVDIYVGNGRGETDAHDFIPDRSWASLWMAHRKAFRKYVPYYAKEYVFFPLLAGPAFGKVLFGNWLAETARDIYSAATIFCGHVGAEVQSHEAGRQARGRGEWYAMQVEASNDFDVPWPISVLCGGLDLQIEHHLFPHLPPNRLREITSEVQAVCEAHGVAYRKESWPRTLKKALGHIQTLSRPSAERG